MPVERAPKWYTPGENQDVFLVKHVVLGKVKMEEFSETNPIPRSANRKKAQSLGALKISTESDDFIFDEIHRRDRLEDEEFEDEMEEEEDEEELEDE
mmetsp:Transcript_20210/g.45219  ORF Transcript_20210/g.45219 Transcript_20210/m.45219 type:complete len:97 (+) Transcript_20210:2040-2330(+)